MDESWLPSSRILKLRTESCRVDELLILDKKLNERVQKHRKGVREARDARWEMINRFSRKLSRMRMNWRKEDRPLTLHTFGSSVMGLATKDSDVDLSIEGRVLIWDAQGLPILIQHSRTSCRVRFSRMLCICEAFLATRFGLWGIYCWR